MKRIFVTLLTSMLVSSYCYSQDIITNTANEELKVWIVKLSSTEVIYKKDGQTYTLPKSEIAMIHYENGFEEIINAPKVTDTVPSLPQSGSDLFVLGQMDASKHYTAYKGAGTGTLVVGLISPLVGLIPAIACSSTQPKDSNLNYPDAELMKKADYYNGYTQKSKKIKQGKVWANWGIAFGANIIAVLILSAGQ